MITPIQTSFPPSLDEVKTAEASVYFATAADIAGNLGLPVHIIEAWAARGDLPTLAGGLYDRRWATWLAAGRRATAWRRDVPVKTAVATGWIAACKRAGRASSTNLQAFRELFQRNGFTVADADQALLAGRA